MSNILLPCGVVFLLLCVGIVLLTGLNTEIRTSAKASIEKRLKRKQFKKQGKLNRRVRAIKTKLQTVKAQSALPSYVYYLLTGFCGVGGYAVGRIVFSSQLLSLLVGILALLLPVIIISFKQNKLQSKWLTRLASSMTLLSNSYIASEDIIASVQENLPNLEYPEPFRDFLTYVSLMDCDTKTALRRMENKVNNPYFSQWIDCIVLAQSDRSLRYVTMSVVDSMHDMLQAQAESDAAMYAVWREYVTTLILIFSVPLVFKFLMHDAYVTMTTSFVGQSLLGLLLCAVVYSVIRAVQINKPMMT